MGAPVGNQNAAKAKRWADAINRALARASEGKGVDGGLDRVADRLIAAALSGDQWAIREVGDRQDGKPAQALEHTGANGEPIQVAWPLPPTTLDR